LRGVGRVSLLQGVVQDDAVVVVGDLGLVAELDRLAEPAFGDGAGVAVVQADPAGGPVRGGPSKPPPGLGSDEVSGYSDGWESAGCKTAP
jgi:hypothetical protein